MDVWLHECESWGSVGIKDYDREGNIWPPVTYHFRFAYERMVTNTTFYDAVVKC